MKKGLVGLFLCLTVGSVWGSLDIATTEQWVAKRRVENPFLLSNILKENRSVVGHTAVDRLRKRKV